jgi:cellulose synthase/poly-beta-1,6-N-acetylglucosamine synthase-like glycosyltransferase
MDWSLAVWGSLCAVFFGVPAAYFVYMKKRSSAGWDLNVKNDYSPFVAIMIPVYNEEKTIRLKLENLSKVSYPLDKMEIVVVNDSSTDSTLREINQYIAENSLPKISIFNSKVHLGKTGCLNSALKGINASVVIISDADCFWPHDILRKALGYLSDPTVGAVTGRELLLNPRDSWVTVGEQYYDATVQAIRIGESKMHSTIFFQGGFAAYKRSVLEEFNHFTDDSGTALDIVQKNKRALLIPEVGFFTVSPTIFRDKFAIKLRRASHLQMLWARCLRLMAQGKLAFPKRIALPEIMLHLINPVLFVVLVVLSVFVFFAYPLLALALFFGACVLFAVKKTRTIAVELIQNTLILLVALSFFVSNRKFRFWKPIEASRFGLSEKLLREHKLI